MIPINPSLSLNGLRRFLLRHRSPARRIFLFLLAIAGIVGVSVVSYLETRNVWRGFMTSLSKWEMMALIALANGGTFFVLMLAFRVSNWLRGDDDF